MHIDRPRRFVTLENSSVRGVLSIAGWTALGQLVYFLALPLISRLYPEETIGQFGMLLGASGVIVPICALRLQVAIPIARPAHLQNLLVMSFSLVLAVSVAGLILAVSGTLAVFGVPPSGVFPCTFALLIALGGGFEVLASLSSRRRDFRSLGAARGTQGAATAISQCATGAAGLSAIGLFLGDLLGRGVSLSVLAIRLLRGRPQPHHQRAPLGATIRRYRGLMMTGSLAGALNSAALNIPVIFIGALWSIEDAAAFFMASRMISTPLGLLTQAVSRVFASDFSRATNGNARRTLHARYFKIILAIGAIPLLLLVPTGAPLFSFVLGEKWINAGVMASALAPSLWIQMATSPISNALIMGGHVRAQLAWDAARFVGVVLVFVSASLLGLDALTTTMLFSGILGATYLAHFLLTQLSLSKS